MEITYKTDYLPSVQEVIELYDDAGLRRPTGDPARIERMYNNSDLVITAWHGEELVGVSRSITDYSWSLYLADLAVKKAYQKSGIGRELLKHTQQAVSDENIILLLAAPAAINYYPKTGMEKVENGFIIHRKR
ncbi:GNAT family N-acetyltransferase [Pedobacter yulinensis]|uniref:GNAT family N-acetyltransferase n=2 Tax=Pedobacter yulinensis TaxID=2126353 RepID=A0A2T3HGW1_9SPHI|nr:GNAT family N-acetyltransferase [Pedobacter yulinensis]